MEHELFQSFCDAMPLGVCLVNMEGKIVYWNAAAEGITGYRSHDVLGRAYRGDLLGVPNALATSGLGKFTAAQGRTTVGESEVQPGRLDAAECPVHAVLRDGRAVSSDLFLRHKGGHRTSVHVEAFPLRDAEGELRGVGEILDDSQCRQEPMAWAAHHERESDLPLGLPALTESRERLQMMLESQAASSSALILIELAEHHAFLQHGGVAMLRQALRVLARTIAGLAPPHSYMGCWSRDRLLLLIPECPREALEELKGKLARVGSSCALKWWGDRLPIPARAAACYLDASQTLDALIEAMERELSPKHADIGRAGDPLTSAEGKE